MKIRAQKWNYQIQVYRQASHKQSAVIRFPPLPTTLTIIAIVVSIAGLALPPTINAAAGATFSARLAPASSGRTSGRTGPPAEGFRHHWRGQLTANSMSVSFGSVAVGGSGLQPMTLTNSGSTSVTISSASVSGTGFAIAGMSTPMTLSAGQSVGFSASFTPSSAGNASGSISIVSDAAGSPMTIALSGTGTQLQWSINPTSLNFGNVNVGSNSSKNITVTNSGTAALTISSATLSGQGFSISGLALPQTVAPGASATFVAQFGPAAAGSNSGSISVNSNAAGSPAIIALSGTGVQGKLTASSTSVSFGSVAVGGSGLQPMTLTNSGSTSVTISSASVSGAGFAIAGMSMPMTLSAGQSVGFSASFTPPSAGSASGSISIASNAPGSPMAIALNGTGTQAQIAVAPSSAAFGSVVVGNSNSQTITVSNGGNASLTVSQAALMGTGFSTSGLNAPLTIAAGKSATFNGVFTPSSAGSASGSLTLVGNAPSSPLTIALSGTGVAASALLAAKPTSLSFGNVNDGTTSTLAVTLTNTGNTNETISGVNATGAGFSPSGVSAGIVLTPNQSTTLTVAFDPATPGSATGTVTVSSTAANSPATISLSGTGVAPASVALSWIASASPDIVGYNEYRGTTLGSYLKLTSSPLAGTTYTDTTVHSGQHITYYYVVTAVNSSGVESADSNPASVTVP